IGAGAVILYRPAGKTVVPIDAPPGEPAAACRTASDCTPGTIGLVCNFGAACTGARTDAKPNPAGVDNLNPVTRRKRKGEVGESKGRDSEAKENSRQVF